jgi:hypothetical protein
MREASALVHEAAKRGMEAVNIDMMKVFINRYLQDTLAKAEKRSILHWITLRTRGER